MKAIPKRSECSISPTSSKTKRFRGSGDVVSYLSEINSRNSKKEKEMRNVILAGCVIMLAGCTSTGIVRMSENTYPPISPDQVRVFEAGDEITGPYEKIAIITAEGDTDLTNKAAMIKKMKKKAAELGANGIILGKFKEATTGQKISQVLLWTSANDKMEATAIRLKAKKRAARPVVEEEGN